MWAVYVLIISAKSPSKVIPLEPPGYFALLLVCSRQMQFCGDSQHHAGLAQLLFQVQAECNVMSGLCKSVYARQKLWHPSTCLPWTAPITEPGRAEVWFPAGTHESVSTFSRFDPHSDKVFGWTLGKLNCICCISLRFSLSLTSMWPGELTPSVGGDCFVPNIAVSQD